MPDKNSPPLPQEILRRARPDRLGIVARRYGSPNVVEVDDDAYEGSRRVVIDGNVSAIVIGIATLIVCVVINAKASKQKIRDNLTMADSKVAGLLYIDDADKSITTIDAALIRFEAACDNAIKELGDAAPDCKTTIEKDRKYVRRAFGAFCTRMRTEGRVRAVCEDTGITWLHDTIDPNTANN